ncbi:flagellar hook-associated protein FlgK [Anaeroselena agilis]|uniref:Flagellar hook-associated protein 1 n=1 Tax=Anaeroselena agilis TaxID=3063788 RepID=A0ABU3P4G1_9FIRM|nr:flagellar hook-associated protein FlgK [Selenomonadales bacterium 4137-cl]
MRSTFSGLNTVVRGIYAQQLSLDTVGHNIANANTEGYSRQRVNLATTLPEVVYGGSGALQVGTGVAIESVTRARDIFMDRQYWKESSSLGYGATSVSTYSQVEDIFNDELPDLGIQTVLNNFWQSWETLSTSASNDSARTAVRERGAELVDAIQHAAGQLKDMVANINDTLSAKVKEINEMSSEIYTLNKQISNIEVGGRDNANDLRDRRDYLTDKLSKMMNVRVFEDSERNYVIQVSDVVLVDGGGYTPLALNNPATSMDADYGFEARYVVVAGGANQRVNFTNGEMKALQEANSTIPKNYLDKLSTISKYLLQEFNAVHRAGFGTDNSTNNNFFGNPSVNYGDPTAIPPVAGPVLSKGGWINALSINSDLYNDGGIAKIAAKTLISNPVNQSNASGGQASVGGTYTAAPAANAYQVRIDNVTGTGQVDQASYSLDGGITWTAVAAADLDTSNANFTVVNNLPNGLSLTVNTDAQNTALDTYNFSVPQGNASGDNAKLLNSKLKDPTAAASGLKGASLDGFYNSMIGELGVQAQTSQRLEENQQTLVDQIENWRQATAGVNIDEEMTNMIRFQKGYNAAARILTSLDEMLDKLINGTGVVGR